MSGDAMKVRDAAPNYAAQVDAHNVPQGYKRTEVDMIPEEWNVRTLASLVQSHNSGIYKRQALYGDGCNIVGVSDIYDIDKVDGQSFASVPLSKEERAKHTLRAGDLLYGESSLVPEGIARTVYVTEGGVGTAFAWHTRRYSVDQQVVLSSYLYYNLQSRWARSYMVSQSIQTAITGINTAAYFGCPITVPPLHEQRAIAEALSDVDGLLGALEALIAKKRAIKQAAMQQLLTGKTRLPGFSGEWETRRLGEVADIEMGQSPSSAFYNTKGAGLPLIQGNADIANRRTIRRIFTTQITKRGRHGDILLSVRAPVGEVSRATFDVCLGRGVCAIRFPNDFLFHYLIYLEPSWARHSKGSTFDSVNSNDVRAVEIPVPEPKEQSAIAAVLSDMDAEIAALEARRDKTRAIKQGMMQQLLTGRVRLVEPSAADSLATCTRSVPNELEAGAD